MFQFPLLFGRHLKYRDWAAHGTLPPDGGPRCPRPPAPRSTEATGSCPTRSDRDFLLLAAPCSVSQRLADVVALKIRVGGENVVCVMVDGQKSDDSPDCDAEPANAWASAHDVGILRDSMQRGHASSICVTWRRGHGRRRTRAHRSPRRRFDSRRPCQGRWGRQVQEALGRCLRRWQLCC